MEAEILKVDFNNKDDKVSFPISEGLYLKCTPTLIVKFIGLEYSHNFEEYEYYANGTNSLNKKQDMELCLYYASCFYLYPSKYSFLGVNRSIILKKEDDLIFLENLDKYVVEDSLIIEHTI